MNDSYISVKKIVNILFKRKIIIVTLFLSIVCTVVLGSFIISSTYESEAKLLLIRDIDTGKALMLKVNPGYRYNTNEVINSEVQIIKSRTVVENVIESLNITSIPVKILLSRLSVSHLRESNIINVSYQSKDPELCAKIVNQLIEEYIKYRSELFRDSEAYEFFNTQIDIADKQISTLEKRQAEFQKEQSFLSHEQQNQILLTKLSAYEQELTEAQTNRLSRTTSLQSFHVQLKNDSLTIIPSTETSDSPSQKDYLARLKSDLLNLEIERNRLLEIYNSQYKDVQKIEKQIITAKETIKKEVGFIIKQEQIAIKALKSRENILRSTIADIHTQIKNQSQKEYKYSEISRGIEDNREIYSMLLKQREEARISLAKTDNMVRIRIISPATIPEKPVKPKKFLNILLSIFLGTGISLTAAFVIEYFDRSISTTEDIEKYLDLSVLSSIPDQN